MGLVQKLELRQGQVLQMTPQLAQAIKLLQMPYYDLQAFVDAEVEGNPLLEKHEEPDNQSDLFQEDIIAEGSPGTSEEDDWLPSKQDLEQTFDTSLDNIFPDDVSTQVSPVVEGGFSGNHGYAGEELTELGQLLPFETSLHDYLLRQLELATKDIILRMVGAHLIDAIDHNGYLTVALEEVSERLGVDLQVVEQTLEYIHSFEPTGVGARSLSECLSLQLKERNRFDPAIQKVLESLDLVAKRDLAGLKKCSGLDVEDLVDVIAEIRNLNPKPGSVFGSEPVQTLIPDVFVRARREGGWHLELNAETIPNVLVNQDYQAILKAGADDSEKSFLTECLAKANWLTKSLEQRARTILKVATEIVRQQEGFFLHGISHLKPMTLKQIAEQLELHESTISRVTANKSFGTDRGTFEMKFFFSSAVGQSNGSESQAAEVIRRRIKQLIENEAANNILSDDALVNHLKQENIDVARRTVAKYREALKIPSSMERRRLKKITV
ncbi:RNA polymerase factor sigma-54 [Microvirga sp. W0021]|uniref:RNA polymerase sigma-54 factor n=1 Tax=Hohaiivirga grylli TaxID=3133970 RepID=A0ABV0BFF1_9HYPH